MHIHFVYGHSIFLQPFLEKIIIFLKEWCYGLNYIPSKFTGCGGLVSNIVGLQMGPWKIIRFRWGHEEHPSNEIGALVGRDIESLLSVSMHKKQGKAKWAHSERAAISKPGREPSPDSNHAGALISDFQPPNLWEKNNSVV